MYLVAICYIFMFNPHLMYSFFIHIFEHGLLKSVKHENNVKNKPLTNVRKCTPSAASFNSFASSGLKSGNDSVVRYSSIRDSFVDVLEEIISS